MFAYLSSNIVSQTSGSKKHIDSTLCLSLYIKKKTVIQHPMTWDEANHWCLAAYELYAASTQSGWATQEEAGNTMSSGRRPCFHFWLPFTFLIRGNQRPPSYLDPLITWPLHALWATLLCNLCPRPSALKRLLMVRTRWECSAQTITWQNEQQHCGLFFRFPSASVISIEFDVAVHEDKGSAISISTFDRSVISSPL